MNPKVTGRKAVTLKCEVDQLKVLLAEVAQCCRTGGCDSGTYKRLLSLIRTVIPFDAASLFLNNEVRNRFEEVAALDGTVEPQEFLSGTGRSGVAGWAADAGKILFLPDRTGANGFDPEKGYAAFLSIPLLTSDRILGVVSFGCREPYALGPKSPDCSRHIGELLVMALESLQSKRDLDLERKALEELRESSSSVSGLAGRLDRMEAIARMAASTNHDINDLLSVIIGNIQCLLATNSIENQNALHRIRRIEKAALQISNSNHNLLKIRKLLGDSLSEDNR